MRAKRIIAVIAASLSMAACAELGLDWDDPCYSCGQSSYQPTCTYDVNGNPMPNCYDYLFKDDNGNPIPQVIVVDGGYYANGEFHPDPEAK